MIFNKMADGATYQAALESAQTVIAEWIATEQSLGREIPKAKGRLKYA